VQLKEIDVPPGEGYQFAVLDDADVAGLVEHVRRQAEDEVGRCYLEASTRREGWVLSDDEVAGRLGNDDGETGKPFAVVIDGRTLSWEEFGQALEHFEGWCFRLVIEDRVQEARTDAKVIELRLSQDPSPVWGLRSGPPRVPDGSAPPRTSPGARRRRASPQTGTVRLPAAGRTPAPHDFPMGAPCWIVRGSLRALGGIPPRTQVALGPLAQVGPGALSSHLTPLRNIRLRPIIAATRSALLKNHGSHRREMNCWLLGK